jgi:hypothetical protein
LEVLRAGGFRFKSLVSSCPADGRDFSIFDDLYPKLARAAMRPAQGEDLNVTSQAKAAFAALERAEDDGSKPSFSARL